MTEDKKLVERAVMRDLNRVIKKMSALPVPVEIVAMSDGLPPPDGNEGDHAFITVTLGTRLDLSKHAAREAAEMFRSVRKRYPKAMIYVNIAGYDDDPREIPHIPEAVRFIQRWARYVGITTPEDVEREHLEPLHSAAFLAACGVFGEAIQEMVKVPPPATKQ